MGPREVSTGPNLIARVLVIQEGRRRVRARGTQHETDRTRLCTSEDRGGAASPGTQAAWRSQKRHRSRCFSLDLPVELNPAL